jgi:hypothetical protein
MDVTVGRGAETGQVISLTEAAMSPQLTARCMLAMIFAILLASALGMLALGPVALSPKWLGVGPDPMNAWLVAAALPSLAAAWWGWWRAGRAPRPARQRDAWRVFFGVALVATVFGGLEHVVPGGVAWRLARVAEASACAILALIFLAERLGPPWASPLALRAAVLSGPAAWGLGLFAQALHGQADERLLLWLECSPLFLLPLGVWGLVSRGLRGADWLVALSFFCGSKLLEIFDANLLAASEGRWSGHSLAHLALAASIGWLAWALWRQGERPGSVDAAADDERAASLPAGAPSSRARDTSAKTVA